MYYRIAIHATTSPTWRWVSTPLNSLTSVRQWFMYYQSFPRDRFRVFSSSSPEDLREQLRRENGELPSTSTPAATVVPENQASPLAAPQGTLTPAQALHVRWWRKDSKDSDETAETGTSTSSLESKRDELERGTGGDHDLPYRFSLPSSTLQLLAWARLLARVEHGDLQSERMPIPLQPVNRRP